MAKNWNKPHEFEGNFTAKDGVPNCICGLQEDNPLHIQDPKPQLTNEQKRLRKDFLDKFTKWRKIGGSVDYRVIDGVEPQNIEKMLTWFNQEIARAQEEGAREERNNAVKRVKEQASKSRKIFSYREGSVEYKRGFDRGIKQAIGMVAEFIKADGIMIYDGNGNIVKFDDAKLKFSKGKYLLKTKPKADSQGGG